MHSGETAKTDTDQCRWPVDSVGHPEVGCLLVGCLEAKPRQELAAMVVVVAAAARTLQGPEGTGKVEVGWLAESTRNLDAWQHGSRSLAFAATKRSRYMPAANMPNQPMRARGKVEAVT